MREERNKIYAERQKVLNMSDSLESYFIAMFARTINHYVNIYCQTDNKRDYDGLFKFISGVLGMALNEETEKEIETMDRKQIKVFLLDLAKKEYKKKADELYYPEQLLELEKVIILRAVNENWKTNIDNIEQLRQSITLRGYGQYNPLVEYQSSAFDLYKRMLSDIDLNVTRSFMRSKILLPEGE